tara:strand:+ start:23251 stop:24234 length:984 start_codon:yes stop_codon:yes gene_type:complete
MSEKIIVTGAAGFIGFSLCRELLKKKVDILAVDNFNEYYSLELKESRYNLLMHESKECDNFFSFKRLDLTDKNALEKVMVDFKPSIVCHLAAQAGVRYSLENPQTYVDNNINATLNLLEISRKIGVKDIVFSSTSSVYGLSDNVPFSEGTKLDSPISPYSSTKLACEALCHTYHYLYGIRFRILRFFTVYGPWGRPDMALFIFTKSIIENKPIKVFNSGDMKRDFTYIDDIIAGFLLAIDKSYDFEIFNLGFGKTVKLENFIDILERNLGKKAIKKYFPLQPGDVPATWSDISKAREMLGYNPKVDVSLGISNFVNWYNQYNDSKNP